MTPNLALRLGKFLGNGPGIWLHMQDACDLRQAEQEISAELDNIRTYQAA